MTASGEWLEKGKAHPSPPFATTFAPLTADKRNWVPFGCTQGRWDDTHQEKQKDDERRLQVRAESQRTAIECEEQWRVTSGEKTKSGGERERRAGPFEAEGKLKPGPYKSLEEDYRSRRKPADGHRL